jgi:hypothetical protein
MYHVHVHVLCACAAPLLGTHATGAPLYLGYCGCLVPYLLSEHFPYCSYARWYALVVSECAL